MDIYSFINSKDIRKYLREIGYEFNTLETAWLIYQCNSICIDEKIKAWEKLIDTMPDCEVERGEKIYIPSLHKYLIDYINAVKNIEKKLWESSGSVYELHFKTDRRDICFGERYYVSNKDHALKLIEDYKSVEYIEYSFLDITKIKLNKIKALHSSYRLTYSRQFDLMDIDFYEEGNKDAEVLGMLFESLWFDFPVPFKKGDILWIPGEDDNIYAYGGPFVLIENNYSNTPSFRKYLKKNGGTCDMNADGYFLLNDIQVWFDTYVCGGGYTYMSFEYFEGELPDRYRLLIPFSNYLKGEIDGFLLAASYNALTKRVEAEKAIPVGINDRGLELGGIKKISYNQEC